MKKNILVIVLLISGLLLNSCGNSSKKLSQKIQKLETSLFKSNTAFPDKTKMNELLGLYSEFVKEYPKDTLAPEYLYKSANLCMNNSKNEEAVSNLDQLIKDYPGYSKLPEAYFLKAFIYDNNIKNIEKAKDAYVTFLQKFPKHDLANDAAISLGNLGKTPEQIIMEFDLKNKQKADSIAAAKTSKKQD